MVTGAQLEKTFSLLLGELYGVSGRVGEWFTALENASLLFGEFFF